MQNSAPPESSNAPTERRLGLFGGSFDPVHLGHVHVARAAQEAFRLDRIVFVPAARPPHKPGRILAEGEERLAMLELVCRDEPSWSVSRIELDRQGPSYTMDTVQGLAREVHEPSESAIFMILGSDNLPGLPEWSRVEELLRRVQPVVVFRAGTDRSILDRFDSKLSPAAIERLQAGFLDLPPVVASSTGVREFLGGQSGAPLELPEEVWEYIRSRGLYRRS